MMTKETAARIGDLLGAEFGKEHLPHQQVLCLVEEAGEVVKAYRRWKGWARRSGPFEDIETELADVVITTYITAAVFGWEIPDPDPVQIDAIVRVPEYVHVTRIGGLVDDFREEWEYESHNGKLPNLAHRWVLKSVVEETYRFAKVLGIDLDAAIDRKLEVVFARGWREEVTPG